MNERSLAGPAPAPGGSFGHVWLVIAGPAAVVRRLAS